MSDNCDLKTAEGCHLSFFILSLQRHWLSRSLERMVFALSSSHFQIEVLFVCENIQKLYLGGDRHLCLR